MSLRLGDTTIAGSTVQLGQPLNIGQIIPSAIPLTDAGLHLLDGSLILGNGIYSDFVDYIAGIYDPTANYFCTEVEWQTAVTTYGVCGKFVYDSVNNTVRLPKITGFIEGTTDVSALGDLVEAGLPNITGVVGMVVGNGQTGAFSSSALGTRPTGETSTYYNVNFDASRSSSIYGNSSTVQPQTIKAFYYIVIATSTKTDIQVDIDEIATDLNGKADVDLSNCTKPHIVETYVNGLSWYRVYSDGWCEQGGHYTHNNVYGTVTTALLKNFSSTNYNLQITKELGSSPASSSQYQYISSYVANSKTTSSFQVIMTDSNRLNGYDWQASGYIN